MLLSGCVRAMQFRSMSWIVSYTCFISPLRNSSCSGVRVKVLLHSQVPHITVSPCSKLEKLICRSFRRQADFILHCVKPVCKA